MKRVEIVEKGKKVDPIKCGALFQHWEEKQRGTEPDLIASRLYVHDKKVVIHRLTAKDSKTTHSTEEGSNGKKKKAKAKGEGKGEDVDED